MRKGFFTVKKICLVLFSVLMMLLVVGCGNSGPKKMVIGLDDNFAPMGFRNEKNEIVGFDIDLAREACKRAGMEVTFKPIDWSAKEAELNGKRIDAIWNCFTINPEREKVIQFSKPYINNSQVVAVPVKSNIQTIADLKGKTVGVQDDSTGSYLLDGKYADLRKGLKEYKKYPDFAAAFLDIDSGRLDALVVDEILVRYYMKKAPDKYRVLKEDLGKEVVGVGFRKDDKEFAARIDKVLDEMKKDGTCKKISMQWFGTDITRYDEKK
ncbi:MAG: amino acid ABC transporter substrate-binding protein [Acidaminococcaceae bacterium]|nr:amino acid ABC transporter substrate-binding protein [Acidaminococcaceae bacterium]MBQ5344031.1 amino acid ABC transporter substrate-binding protein [Acidaminococcaceae bacterium]